MQLFVIGKTKTGKTTLSNYLFSQDVKIYEAGSWARIEHSEIYSHTIEEMSIEYKNSLTDYALKKLKDNPYYSIEKYLSWRKENSISPKDTVVIIGVRNPDDFIFMLKEDKDNKVIIIDSDKSFDGSLENFEQGIYVINSYLEYKNNITNNIPVYRIKECEINEIQKNQSSIILAKLKEFYE